MNNKLCVIFISLCVLVSSLHVSATQQQYSRRYSECQIRRLRALRPDRRFEAEGGVTEIWVHTKNQLHCAGVSVMRQTIYRNGLVVPGYNNAAKLTYVVRGQGVHGVVIPGCPETYQSVQVQQFERYQGRQFQDQHQKVRRVSRGDIVANPTGFVHWFYNDGDSPLVLLTLLDTGNSMNQLDHQIRRFYLAGNPRKQEERERGGETYEEERDLEIETNNIFDGFDDQVLQEVLGVSRDIVDKIKSRDDTRGHMILVKGGLKLIRPSRTQEEEEEEQQRYIQQYSNSSSNGIDETLCTARLRENIGRPSRADIYNPQAGRLSIVNSLNLPILSLLKLSAEKGVLHRNAILAPHWNMNSHTVIYAVRGSARVQIVGNYRGTVYDGLLNEGEVLVVPQNFAVMKQAGSRGFEWVSFKTNENAMIHSLAGKTSALRGLPLDMLASMYQITRQEAENLKHNRGHELMIFSPSSSSSCSRCAQRAASAAIELLNL